MFRREWLSRRFALPKSGVGWQAHCGETLDRAIHLGGVDGFRDVVIHAGRKTAFAVAFERLGGHGHDGNVAASLMLALTDLGGGFVAVHDRHLHVHENDIELLFRQRIDCLLSIFHQDHVMPA